MYNWRKMSPTEREALLASRKANRHPWHSPPHQDVGPSQYHLTAACFEHRPIMGASAQRLGECEADLLETIATQGAKAHAWCVLPNHYHLLVYCEQLKPLLSALGQFHGRTSCLWNKQDDKCGRQVWCKCTDRTMRSDRHFWATLNYVHHNAVHHAYVQQWEDWPFSSAGQFLETVGREEAMRIWDTYPVLDYGKGWDDPAL